MKFLRKLFPKKVHLNRADGIPAINPDERVEVVIGGEYGAITGQVMALAKMMYAQSEGRGREADEAWIEASLHNRTLFVSYAMDLIDGKVVRFSR